MKRFFRLRWGPTSISRYRIWRDRVDTIRLYYRHPTFAFLDLFFGLLGLFSNPYRVCRKFLQQKGEKNVHAYGETPYTTYAKMAQKCGIGPTDVWLELGSGRGKGCFWLHTFVGCRVIGIEQIPSFVKWSERIRRLFHMKGVRFEKKDINHVDLREATIVYLYGLERDIPKGVKVITTGEPLEDSQIITCFWVRFPWGRTTAFLCKKN